MTRVDRGTRHPVRARGRRSGRTALELALQHPQHHGVQAVPPPEALLQVLHAPPGLQGDEHRIPVLSSDLDSAALKAEPETPHQLIVHGEQGSVVGLLEIHPPQPGQPLQLCDRLRVVIYPKVDHAIVQPAVAAGLSHHEEGGGLPPPPISARLVSGAEGRQQPVAEVAGAGQEGLPEGVGHLRPGEDVALTGAAGRRAAPGPVEAGAAGVVRGSSIPVHDPQLAVVPVRVGSGEPLHHHLGW